MLSGAGADDAHDHLDGIAISLTSELVLTSASARFEPATALEFLNTRPPSADSFGHDTRTLLSVSSSLEGELRVLETMISYVRRSL